MITNPPTCSVPWPDPKDYAFPSPSLMFSPGMTLRAHFAGLAMQGLLACAGGGAYDSRWSTSGCAALAIQHADSLIAALNKTP